MNTKAWFSCKNFSSDPVQGIKAEIQVPADVTWFDGHFPGEPILPGVAQIALVIQLLKTALKKPVAPQSISRVRFKKVIRPEETIAVHITPKDDEQAVFAFSLTNGTEKVCGGSLTMAANKKKDE